MPNGLVAATFLPYFSATLTPMRLIMILLFFYSAAATAQQTAYPIEAQRVQSFLDRTHRVCVTRPAKICVDAAWNFAAATPQHGLTRSDVASLQENLQTWYSTRQDKLRPQERASIGFGLMLAQGIGAERLHGLFDTNGDGLVTKAELLDDVALDNRPLDKVLSDPKAVDRAGLARRLKLPPSLVEVLFRQ